MSPIVAPLELVEIDPSHQLCATLFPTKSIQFQLIELKFTFTISSDPERVISVLTSQDIIVTC